MYDFVRYDCLKRIRRQTASQSGHTSSVDLEIAWVCVCGVKCSGVCWCGVDSADCWGWVKVNAIPLLFY